MLHIGTSETVAGVLVQHPPVLGMVGWQRVYVAWGLPAVVLSVIVLFAMTDRPAQARWLTPAEREALERALADERAAQGGSKHMTLLDGLRQPKVLLLALAYFFAVTANYGVESRAWPPLSPGKGTSTGSCSRRVPSTATRPSAARRCPTRSSGCGRATRSSEQELRRPEREGRRGLPV